MIKQYIAILSAALLICSNADDVDAEQLPDPDVPTVYERLLHTFLAETSAEYAEAENPKVKEGLEYKIYRTQFIYWVHVYKFDQEPSRAIERKFGILNYETFKSDSFLEMVRRGGCSSPKMVSSLECQCLQVRR